MASSLVFAGCKKEEEDEEPKVPVATKSIITDETMGRPNQSLGCVEIENRVTTIEVWDNATIDGDIVTLIANGTDIILENFELDGPANSHSIQYTFPNNGANSLTLYAENEGDLPPNTVTIRINGDDQFSISSNLVTNGAIDIVVLGYGVTCDNLQ